MRIIGIDPGIERTGFAILEMEKGKIKVMDFGRILTDKKLPFSRRLTLISADLKSILHEWKPEAAALEQIFFSKNVKTAMKVSSARGVILEILESHGIPIMEFNPGEIKLSVTGDGKADKLQIRKMLQYILGIDIKNDDTADAVACGLCLLTSRNILHNS